MAALTEATDNVVDAPAPPLSDKKRASDASAPAAKRPSLGPSPAKAAPATSPLLKFTPEDQALLVELCKKPFERQRSTAPTPSGIGPLVNIPFGEQQLEFECIFTWSHECAKLDIGNRGVPDEFEARHHSKEAGCSAVCDMSSAFKAIDIDFHK